MTDMSNANSEIEVALQNDQFGDYKKKLINLFYEEHRKINKQLNKGVPPEEYACLSALIVSIEEAIDVVEKMWVEFQK